MNRYPFLAFIFMLVGGSVFAQDANDILKKVDTNIIYDTITFDADLVIQNAGKRQVKAFHASARSDKNYFSEFTNQEDLGTKYLKKDGNLFIYLPDLEEVTPIVGHMLKQSIMGSDMSYEDMINNDNLASSYTATILNEEKFNGIAVWVLELNAKTKSVSYQKQKLWVDKELYYPLKTEMYAVSGTLLKVMEITETGKINGKNFPITRITKDLLRKDSVTTITFKNIKMDIKIPDSLFSLRSLNK
jgi:outer membrane lipoprotein-sorting protein